jgi:hypothetical protein
MCYGRELPPEYVDKFNIMTILNLENGLYIKLNHDTQGHCTFEARLKKDGNISYIKGDESNLKWSARYNIKGPFKSMVKQLKSIEISITNGDKSEHKFTFTMKSWHGVKIDYVNTNPNSQSIPNATFIVKETKFKFGYMALPNPPRQIASAFQCMKFIYQTCSDMTNLNEYAQSSQPSSINPEEKSYGVLSPYELYDHVHKDINPDKKLLKKCEYVYINGQNTSNPQQLLKIDIDNNHNWFNIIVDDKPEDKYFAFSSEETYTEISKDKIVLINTSASSTSAYGKKLEISVYRDAQKQKKYHITLQGSQVAYSFNVDDIDYYDNFNDDVKIHLSEIMDSNRYTFLDYIEDYLKRAKFIINYK